MNEYTFIKKSDGYTLDSRFPNQLKGVITPQEFNEIVAGFSSTVRRLPLLVYIILPVLAFLIFIVKFFGLSFVQFLIVMGIILAFDLGILIFIIVFYIINKFRFGDFIESLNQKYQYRSISFSSPSFFLFKIKIHYNTGVTTKNFPFNHNQTSENLPLMANVHNV
ncbi:hypothetical protein ACTA71_011031 [Dictyostelium dimigraforme]